MLLTFWLKWDLLTYWQTDSFEQPFRCFDIHPNQKHTYITHWHRCHLLLHVFTRPTMSRKCPESWKVQQARFKGVIHIGRVGVTLKFLLVLLLTGTQPGQELPILVWEVPGLLPQPLSLSSFSSRDWGTNTSWTSLTPRLLSQFEQFPVSLWCLELSKVFSFKKT